MTEPRSLELFLVTEKEYYGYMKTVIITNIILYPREFNALFVKITIRKNTSTASSYVKLRTIFFLKHVNTYIEETLSMQDAKEFIIILTNITQVDPQAL